MLHNTISRELQYDIHNSFESELEDCNIDPDNTRTSLQIKEVTLQTLHEGVILIYQDNDFSFFHFYGNE